MKATFKKYILNFKQASGTSRGIMNTKETYFLIIEDNGKIGIGECGLFRGLSYDNRLDYSDKLQWVCDHVDLGVDVLWNELREWPSIQFGLEQAFLSLQSNNPFVLFPSRFTECTKAIPINGLAWMGSPEFMKQQITDKISNGFNCIKIKIGAIDFEEELNLIASIRNDFSPEMIEIRVDANGGFNYSDALNKINQLSEYKIHSIEQPVKQNQYDSMAELCKSTSIPIALDEELIGVVNIQDKENLLLKIKPQYIILKPSLVGGFKGSQEWIDIAEKLGIGWWVTSALESNIGLNAIAQWTFTLENNMPQGLGTGGLFTNNFETNLYVKNGHLWFSDQIEINLESMLHQIEN
ncbi:o-succinylbenzoate synthase [Paenimyroides baculatum]|uniref:O-succinylbenzoate synthase n=1 Tax=Paenimyroides baculatum TaxID=2608000 RepID=A0A5M6CR44_9FLAO|nr:o-succinylbenzoate synthase [Paenimyroides baculatum]KAA5537654.1 o-succinylbenzoate synthase [Paenimyroides baculatum]